MTLFHMLLALLGVGGIGGGLLAFGFGPAMLLFGGKALKLAWAWLCHRSFWQLACIALALFAGLQTIRLHGEQRHSAKIQRQLTRIVEAEKEAAKRNKAEVAAKEAQFKRNNDEAVANLNDRLERLRRELRAGAQSGSAQPRPPKADNPTGAVGETRVCLAAEDVLRAAENEERHDELITLIEKQLKAQ